MTQQQIDDWNEFHKPGDPCLVTLDDGKQIETRTRSVAWLLTAGHPVVQIVGKSGCYLLTRVRMMEVRRP